MCFCTRALSLSWVLAGVIAGRHAITTCKCVTSMMSVTSFLRKYSSVSQRQFRNARSERILFTENDSTSTFGIFSRIATSLRSEPHRLRLRTAARLSLRVFANTSSSVSTTIPLMSSQIVLAQNSSRSRTGPTLFSPTCPGWMVRASRQKLDPRDRLRAIAGKAMEDACCHLREGALVRGGPQGAPVGLDDVAASLAHAGVVPPAGLLDEVWAKVAAPGERVSIWNALTHLPAPKPGRAVARLQERIAGVQKAIAMCVEKKKFRQVAELRNTEQLFWGDLNNLRLGAEGDDSAFKVRERELQKLVDSATTATNKKLSEATLNNFRDLMMVGHTPTPTPRGSRFMVIDYERPRTAADNCIIDLLAPDNHQDWRGMLRRSHVNLWQEKHDAKQIRYKAVMDKCQYERDRAHALAFSKAPYPPQAVLENRTAEVKAKAQEVEVRTRPSTCSSLSPSITSHCSNAGSNIVTEQVCDAVRDLLMHLKDIHISLNDALAFVKVVDTVHGTFVDADKLREIWGVTSADESSATHKWQLFQALWSFMSKNKNPLDRDLCGRVTLQDAKASLACVLQQSDTGMGPRVLDADARSWTHFDPSLGKITVSAGLHYLLVTVRDRIKHRWHKGISDAFQMLEAPGKLVGRSEIRAVLHAIAITPSAARFEALWSFLDQHNRGKIRWIDFKQCFEMSENVSPEICLQSLEEEDKEAGEEKLSRLIPVVSMGSKPKLKKKRSRPLPSSIPKVVPTFGDLRPRFRNSHTFHGFADFADEDDLQDMFRSLYDVTLSQTVKELGREPSFDRYSKWSPLGRRAWKCPQYSKQFREKLQQQHMRPLSVQSCEADRESLAPRERRESPEVRRSVHWRTRDMGVQADEVDNSACALPGISRRQGGPPITLTPFSNLRNGSGLKMQWQRWTGGNTRNPHKSANEDPCAPGETASLLIGAGEFRPAFERNMDIAQSLKKILEASPDTVFDMDQQCFRHVSPTRKLPTPSASLKQDMQDFVHALFPTGLATSHST